MNNSFKRFRFLLCPSPSSSTLRSFTSLCLLSEFAVSMALNPISAVYLSSVSGDCSFRRPDFVGSVSFEACSAMKNGLFSSSSRLSFSKRKNHEFMVFASSGDTNMALTGVVFQPFEEVKKSSLELPIQPHLSLARQSYTDDCEVAINKHINVEYNVSYAYHAMFAYFDRDNIALQGLAKFFKESSEEEREHAEKLIKYQNIRGGRVALYPIQSPPSEFEHAEKGDALYAMELALSLEKLTNEKLLQLHKVADANNDPQMADFIESEFLTEQVEAIKKISEYVVQLRMVGKGHGVWHFDQMLLHHGRDA